MMVMTDIIVIMMKILILKIIQFLMSLTTKSLTLEEHIIIQMNGNLQLFILLIEVKLRIFVVVQMKISRHLEKGIT